MVRSNSAIEIFKAQKIAYHLISHSLYVWIESQLYDNSISQGT